MGRIRTVKPELFLDEHLGALSGDHVVLFIGLLTVADREGRLAWRPSRLKATLFPYRAVDVEALSVALDAADKVQRYAVNGEEYLWIPGFVRHQRPHPKEPESVLPPAPHREKKRPAVEESASIPSSPVGREGKGREGDLGKEEDLPRAAPAGTRVKKDTAGKKQPTDPREGGDATYRALVSALFLLFRDDRGEDYEPSGRDWTALGRLRAKHETGEIIRRWGHGVRAKYKARCSCFWDLETKWNDCLAPEATGGAQKRGPDPNQGIPARSPEQMADESDMWAAVRENRKAEGLDG
jgi:hypothetical protein